MHPISVRRKAVELVVERGLTVSEASRRLGVSRAAIRGWRDNGVLSVVDCECPERPNSAAYAALLGFYLGDGCVSEVARTCVLRVSCDQSYPRIIADVTGVIETTHLARPVHHVQATGAIVVQNAWKHWPCLYDYPRWQFVNRSEEILGWCGDALDLVDVAWKRSHRWTISVSRRAAVQRLDELVGPKA
ncbi:MAG: hypothetical protein JWR90_1537 [Marmoricola sp.]|jgi:hypothetical protein|nr:hypothetical protein [Marmoricola sp.]